MLKHSLKFLADAVQTCRIEHLDASDNVAETHKWAEILRVGHAKQLKENDDDGPTREPSAISESTLVQQLHASRFLNRSPTQRPMASPNDDNWP